jgi:DNA-binding FrmR family transcriptional regulator
MVTEGRPCPEVLMQIAAVRGAVDRIARLILDEHLSECIARAAVAGNIEAEIAELKAALDRFLP